MVQSYVVSGMGSAAAIVSTYLFYSSKRYYEKIIGGQQNTNQYNYARSLIEASLDPLVTICPDGKITDVNDATINATGMKREELIGTDFSDYFTEPEKAREGYQKVLQKGFVKGYELILKHKNGTLMPVQYSASLYRNEMGQVQGVFAAARDISELVILKSKLEAMALYDHLTELPNRRYLCTDGKDLVFNAKNDNYEVAVAFIDINNFKPINDTYGHPIGDKLLRWFASKLSNAVRESDLISRYGGDEFVIIFNHALHNKEAYENRIHNALTEKFTFIHNGKEIALQITASIGIVFLSESNGYDLHIMIDMADKLMYKNKNSRRNILMDSDY